MPQWERLTPLLGANEFRLVLVLIVAGLAIRFLLRGHARRRATAAVAFLALAALLHPLPGADTGPLALLAAVLVGTGPVVLAAVVVFALVLARAAIRAPSIVRDLLQVLTLFLALLILLRRSGVDLVSLVPTSAVLTAVIG